jgi:hypothetical protein
LHKQIQVELNVLDDQDGLHALIFPLTQGYNAAAVS